MYDISVRVNVLAAGQPRAYADSVYHAIVEIHKVYGDYSRAAANFDERDVKHIIQALVHRFVEEPVSVFDATLTKLENIGPGEWEVIITERYTD